MSISSEFDSFVVNWLAKAGAINLNGLSSYYDKFFTLFVVYNRLYAEATFILDRKNEIQIDNRNRFPDSMAAKKYVSVYMGAQTIIDALETDQGTHVAIDKIIDLIARHRFAIKLDMFSGDIQPHKDLALLERLRSEDRIIKEHAVLDVIYSIRCNMYHGHKQYHIMQIELLNQVLVILEKLIEILYDKIRAEA